MRANHEKAIEISNRILDECTDQTIRNFVTNEKINALRMLGRIDEAIALAEKLPLISWSYEFKLKDLYAGDKLREHCKSALMAYVQNMYAIVQSMADLNFDDDSLTIEERIGFCHKAIELMNVVYEGNYGTESMLISRMHRYIAAMEALRKNTDETMTQIEKAAEYAVAYDTMPETMRLSSTLLNGRVVHRGNLFVNFSRTECAELFDRLKQERYDIVRDTERFKAVLKKITPYVEGV